MYGDFADPFNLSECKLSIVHCAGHFDVTLIESLWSEIIEQGNGVLCTCVHVVFYCNYKIAPALHQQCRHSLKFRNHQLKLHDIRALMCLKLGGIFAANN